MNVFTTILLATLCLSWQSLSANEGLNAESMAEQYFVARSSLQTFPDLVGAGEDDSDEFLYSVQQELVSLQVRHGASIGGYKGGLIPKLSVGGVLFADGILRGSSVIERQDYRNLMVEAEIAFRMCKPVREPIANVVALKSATCMVYPAIELPDAAIGNLDELLKDIPQLRKALIPTNMLSASVLLGAGKDPAEMDINSLPVRVSIDGTEIAHRDAEPPNGDIWARTLWVINEFILAQGYELTAEHIIIPGALTGIHPGNAGSYNIDFGALGEVTFRIVE
ncbi:MAG: 2-keto-4-pentenoate hydratase [Gammaproteobacteria bacterium]|jgi:2-keto-4-pentenoate hydratase